MRYHKQWVDTFGTPHDTGEYISDYRLIKDERGGREATPHGWNIVPPGPRRSALGPKNNPRPLSLAFDLPLMSLDCLPKRVTAWTRRLTGSHHIFLI
jgi:hypothetical protein